MVLSELDKTVEFITEDKRVNMRPRSSSFGSCFKDSFICHESLIRLQQNTKGLTPSVTDMLRSVSTKCVFIENALKKTPICCEWVI